mmetsp:Transcript_18460/g.58291  ORF Transcript_18460/g.58291 Transcript_18460/m.58291 type:complete len:259 (-) Transcript_18460:4954-5730(-)
MSGKRGAGLALLPRTPCAAHRPGVLRRAGRRRMGGTVVQWRLLCSPAATQRGSTRRPRLPRWNQGPRRRRASPRAASSPAPSAAPTRVACAACCLPVQPIPHPRPRAYSRPRHARANSRVPQDRPGPGSRHARRRSRRRGCRTPPPPPRRQTAQEGRGLLRAPPRAGRTGRHGGGLRCPAWSCPASPAARLAGMAGGCSRRATRRACRTRACRTRAWVARACRTRAQGPGSRARGERPPGSRSASPRRPGQSPGHAEL